MVHDCTDSLALISHENSSLVLRQSHITHLLKRQIRGIHSQNGYQRNNYGQYQKPYNKSHSSSSKHQKQKRN